MTTAKTKNKTEENAGQTATVESEPVQGLTQEKPNAGESEVATETVEPTEASDSPGSDYDDFSTKFMAAKSVRQAEVVKLDWFVDDFAGKTESVYEAIVVASQRARQIGRVQKAEVDRWNEIIDARESEEGLLDDELEPGVERFHHPKPTVKALKELKNGIIKFKYGEK